MAEAGKIYPSFTSIEIDEKGQIWLIQNGYESGSVIVEMECSSKGRCIINNVIPRTIVTDNYDYYDDFIDLDF